MRTLVNDLEYRRHLLASAAQHERLATTSPSGLCEFYTALAAKDQAYADSRALARGDVRDPALDRQYHAALLGLAAYHETHVTGRGVNEAQHWREIAVRFAERCGLAESEVAA